MSPLRMLGNFSKLSYARLCQLRQHFNKQKEEGGVVFVGQTVNTHFCHG
jgi:hypothetical protein